MRRRHALSGIAATSLAAMLGGCGGGGAAPSPSPTPAPTPTPTPTTAQRSYRMGFSPNPPRPTLAAVLEGIDLWSARAEIAFIHEELPWADLIAGTTPAAILARDKVQLVQYLRAKGLSFSMMLDLTNGLARESEAPALTAAGRSLAEPAIQALARDYALAVQSTLTPEFLGLAAETNLVRLAAPPALYQALKTAAAAIESALAAAAAPSRRFISVQAETAWGRIGSSTAFAGIAQDLADFPFTAALGISSYPYFGYADPADIPADYYTRLRGTNGLPVIVSEGGWSSASVGTITSTPAKQAAYITRHHDLLASVQAVACIQLNFTDIDTAAFPQPLPANLALFTSLGLTDANFAAKPALAAWDALFARGRG